VSPFEATTSTAYTDLATVGPSVIVPLAGDYEITICAQMFGTAGDFMGATVKLGAAAASDEDGIINNGSTQQYPSHTMRRNGIAASALLKMQYRTGSGGSGQAARRELTVRPVRVG
jgi:hypothetical protein